MSKARGPNPVARTQWEAEVLEHRQDRRNRRGRRLWTLLAVLLATVLLLVVGCNVITGVDGGCVPTGGEPPEPAELGEIAVTYLDTGGLGYLGLGDGQRLVVMKDGRALALRDDGERMVLTLSPGELEQFRNNLARDVGPLRGGFEILVGAPTDLPVYSLTFVEADREVRQVRYKCGDPEGWIGAAVDRLAALRERVLTEGTVDTGAPIQVTFSVSPDRIDESHRDVGAWPADITPPEVPPKELQLTYRVYEGDQAARLRNLLVPSAEAAENGNRTVTVTLPDGTVVGTWWTAVLPAIGGESVF